jgi:hypothetical protein
MFKTKIRFMCLLLIAGIAFSQTLMAGEVENEEAEVTIAEAEQPKWHSDIQTKYALTDEQMKSLKDSGLSYPQIAKVAQLAKSSTKPIGDVLAMRIDQKMGWGKIAKALGVHPGELGQAVSSLRHEGKDDRQAKLTEKKLTKAAKAAEKREMRAQRNADKKAGHKSGKH